MSSIVPTTSPQNGVMKNSSSGSVAIPYECVEKIKKKIHNKHTLHQGHLSPSKALLWISVSPSHDINLVL